MDGRWIARACGLAMLAALAAGLPGTLPGGDVDAANRAWLGAASAEIRHDVTLLAEIWALLNIVQSTEIGVSLLVSADIEVGQALSSLAALVGQAMAVGTAAAALAAAWSVVLTLCAAAAPVALQAVLLFGGLSLLGAGRGPIEAIRAPLRDLAVLSARVFAVLWVVVPYALNLSGWASERATAFLGADDAAVVSNLHADMAAGSAGKDPLDYWRKKDHAVTAFHSIHKDLTHKVSALGRYVTLRLVHAVCAGLLVPLLASVLLWAALRSLVRGAAPLVADSFAAAEEAALRTHAVLRRKAARSGGGRLQPGE